MIFKGDYSIGVADDKHPLPDIEFSPRVVPGSSQQIGVRDIFLNYFVLEFPPVFELVPLCVLPLAKL